MAFCKTRPALAALSLVFLAACGDSGPSTFDAAAMSSDIAVLDSVDSNNDISQVFTGVDGVLGGSAMLNIGQLASRPLAGRDARTATTALKATLARPVINASAAIPPEAAGKTWIYNDATGEYEVSDQPGAPSNGVRILLYEQDIDGHFILPLVETGHVDLTDLSSGSTRKGRLQAVKGSTTFVDYTVSVTGDESNGDIGVEGFLLFGAGRLNVDFSAQGSTSGSTTTFDLTSSLEFPSRDVSFDFGLNGSVNDDAGTGTFSLTETINSPNGRMDVLGSGGYDTDFTYTIKVNGDTWATYDGVTLTPVDGRTFTASEQHALEGAAELTITGVLLPLALVLVMAALTGALPPFPG